MLIRIRLWAILCILVVSIPYAVTANSDASGGMIGISPIDLTPEISDQLAYRGKNGVVVYAMAPGGPAANAGIKVGDILIEYADNQIIDSAHLTTLVLGTPIGKSVLITLVRSGKQKTLTVAPRRKTDWQPLWSWDGPMPEGAAIGFGIAFHKPTPEILDAFGLLDAVGVPALTTGLVVLAIDPNSPATTTLVPGDIVEEIDWKTITDPQEAIKRLSKLKESGKVSVAVFVRRGWLQFYEILRI